MKNDDGETAVTIAEKCGHADFANEMKGRLKGIVTQNSIPTSFSPRP